MPSYVNPASRAPSPSLTQSKRSLGCGYKRSANTSRSSIVDAFETRCAEPLTRSLSWHPATQAVHTELREAMKLDRLKERIQQRRHNEGAAIAFKWRIAILAVGVLSMTGICIGAAFAGGPAGLVVLAVLPNLFVAGAFFMAKDFRRKPDPDRVSKGTFQGLGLVDHRRSAQAFRALQDVGVFDAKQHVERVPSVEELEQMLAESLGTRAKPQLIRKIYFTLRQYDQKHGLDLEPARRTFGFRRNSLG